MSEAATRLAHVRELIARSAGSARRKSEDVTLVAVTKQRGVSEIEELIAAGATDFGESRVQEAAEKWPPIRAAHPRLKLHMIGRLQSNKAADRRYPSVYVQVNIGAEEQKGGIAIAELPALLDQVRSSPLPLAGLMAIPPLDQQPGPYFALLAELARRHGVTGLSMGMSADYPTAVMLGATVVRVGSALFQD
jgi:uncharacterized pyridoxal phosphate-containing UPF0001 family protein